MKKLIIIGMLLMAGFHNAQAKFFQKTIVGQVLGGDDGQGIPRANVMVKGTTEATVTDLDGSYKITVKDKKAVLVFSFVGYKTTEVRVGKRSVINVTLQVETSALEEVVVVGYASQEKKARQFQDLRVASGVRSESMRAMAPQNVGFVSPPGTTYYLPEQNSESYAEIEENGFQVPWQKPRSTFSIDVDVASYSNTRRYINSGQLPPKDAVKVEELINYFNYDYQGPTGKHPFAVHHEVSVAPWNPKHQLVHIGLQGKKIKTEKLPASNLVFLLDVSGSMNSPYKLPLLKRSLKLLVNELREEDKVAIVVYAGAAGEVLPATAGSEKSKILNALDKLSAGGSTAGGAGIELAYKIAKQNFVEGGNNRIILATDGDFNVGASSDQAMEDLVEEKRNEGVFLTVLGFGTGNYKDSKMEVLADKGNGNHAYIDNILEAKKVLVNEFGGTLFTIAKDVKIQVEFNPANVQAYRLIGYENRQLADVDFNNDKKDAGELGAGHTVTALYEIIPTGVESDFKPLDDLKYQQTGEVKLTGDPNELMTVKLRYKQPDGDKSTLLTEVIKKGAKSLASTSNNFQWSAAVAGFGMLLRDSDYTHEMTFQDMIELARKAKGTDDEGYRSELIKLMETAELLTDK